ncbi:hypothetical protein CR513_35218, partial [Mucuna pruriens]
MAGGGRNDRAIVDALMAVAQAVGNLNQRQEVDWLARFQRNNPPMFRGGYDPNGAVDWIFEVEKIFQAMECPLVQKGIVQFHELANKCRVYDEDNRARVAHYRSGGPIRDQSKHGSSSRSKSYSRPTGNSSVRGGSEGSIQRRIQAPVASQASRGGSVGSTPPINL